VEQARKTVGEFERFDFDALTYKLTTGVQEGKRMIVQLTAWQATLDPNTYRKIQPYTE
jgi:hypothetical protein